MIYVYPEDLHENKYYYNTKKILARTGRKVTSWKKLKITNSKNNISILSFMEDEIFSGDRPIILTLVKVFIVSLVLRVFSNKIIWIRHNIKPHNLNYQPYLHKAFCKWLNIISNKVVVHERDKRVRFTDYVPCPLYTTKVKNISRSRTIEYLVFGQVRKNKNILELVQSWPSNKNLLIVGNCKDLNYKNSIFDEIKLKPNIKFDCRFVPEDELDRLLFETKFVVLTHQDASMIISGSFFHAASLGANIIMTQSYFATKMTEKYSFVSMLDDSNIKYVSSKEVINTIDNDYNDASVQAHWEKILS